MYAHSHAREQAADSPVIEFTSPRIKAGAGETSCINPKEVLSRPTPPFFGGVTRGDPVWKKAKSMHGQTHAGMFTHASLLDRRNRARARL